jgi:hypothetical protein
VKKHCFRHWQEVERELRNSDRTNELLRRELGRLRQFVANIMREHKGASESEAKLAYLAWVQQVGFDACGALCRFVPFLFPDAVACRSLMTSGSCKTQ